MKSIRLRSINHEYVIPYLLLIGIPLSLLAFLYGEFTYLPWQILWTVIYPLKFLVAILINTSLWHLIHTISRRGVTMDLGRILAFLSSLTGVACENSRSVVEVILALPAACIIVMQSDFSLSSFFSFLCLILSYVLRILVLHIVSWVVGMSLVSFLSDRATDDILKDVTRRRSHTMAR